MPRQGPCRHGPRRLRRPRRPSDHRCGERGLGAPRDRRGGSTMSLQCPAIFGDQYSDLCRAIDHYCERTSPDLDAELVNAFTNAAFLLGARLAWRMQGRQPHSAASPLIQGLIVAMAVVGLGSFLFHTIGTRWAEWGDVIPILVFMLLYLWFILSYLFHWATA